MREVVGDLPRGYGDSRGGVVSCKYCCWLSARALELVDATFIQLTVERRLELVEMGRAAQVVRCRRETAVSGDGSCVQLLLCLLSDCYIIQNLASEIGDSHPRSTPTELLNGIELIGVAGPACSRQ